MSEQVEDLDAKRILADYPEDRIRDRGTALGPIAEVVKTWLNPDEMKQAVKACANESEGYTRSKVCFSDNWFNMHCWEKGLAQIKADLETAREAEAKG